MNIWAIKPPVADFIDNQESNSVRIFIAMSLSKGCSRYGFKNTNSDLIERNKELASELKKELKFFATTGRYKNPISFLQKINAGDWVVHINVPKFGLCTAAKVIASYCIDDSHKLYGYDFSHTVKIDTATIIEFHRNSPAVLPIISRFLVLNEKYWSINNKEAFLESIENLKLNIDDKKEKNRFYYFKNAVEGATIETVAEKIKLYYPEEELKKLMAIAFEKSSNVSSIAFKRNTSSSKFERDLYVNFKTSNNNGEHTTLVLINVYKNDELEVKITSHIKNAVKTYILNEVLIVDVNNSHQNITDSINKITTLTNSQINLLAGNDLASFIVKQCPELMVI